jgi:DNA polymerase-3 subunit gamma/tau
MEYLSLYRQFRPGTFDELVGQTHVVKTLQNALASSRVGHAYLFCGPRGTGKTSAAKIFAKALNCINGPTPNPCNECENCKKISQGFSMDVIETDAASNRGINEIRELREKVKFAPSESKYKVYIIDEVHMLTDEAFNALLKTLEEPPKNVVFILATTEPHDVPVTILSRCQRFDFKAIPYEIIQEHLETICRTRDIDIDPQASMLIARRSLGGMRDALSLLEQCIGYCGNVISSQSIREVLGLADISVIGSFIRSLLSKDTTGVIKAIDQLFKESRDPDQFVKETLSYIRDQFVNSVGLSELTFYEKEPELANGKTDSLLSLLEMLSGITSSTLWLMDSRLALEVHCLRWLGDTAKASTINIREVKISDDKIVSQPMVQQQGLDVQEPAVVRNNQLSLVDIVSRWDEVLEGVKKAKVTLKAFIVEGKPTCLENNVLTLTFKKEFSFHKENLALPKNKGLVEDVLNRLFSYPIQLNLVLDVEPQDKPQQPLNEHKSDDIQSQVKQTEAHSHIPVKEIELDPVVREALRIFGGKIVKVDEEGE